MAQREDTRVEDAVRAAQRYYLQDATMDSIAKELRVSRSTVSRLIAFARETGLVEIRVLPPTAQVSEVEAEFRDRYRIRAHVVHVPEHATPVERHQRTASQATRVLNSIFTSDMILALAWGTMVREISEALTARTVTNCRVVLLNGIGNPRALGEHYSSAILTAFGAAYNAYIQRLPLPIFLDRAEIRDALFAERSVQAATAMQRDADVALFSLGHVENGVPSSPYRSGYFLDQQDFQQLVADGVVGDLATTFIRTDGSHRGIAMNRRTTGPDLDQFVSIPHRICAVSGDHKIPALRAALRGGLITDLVIDETTARACLTDTPIGTAPEAPRQ